MSLEKIKISLVYFSIKCDDAYGPIDEKAIAELPRNLFEHEGNLGELVKVGNFVPMKDQEGNSLQGLVIDINEEHVKMDFNHPLAEKELMFSGKVLKIKTTERVVSKVKKEIKGRK